MATDASAPRVEHDVLVHLTIITTHEDVQDCLSRSGIVPGTLIGEALIDDVNVYSPETDAHG